ncbi:MAG TPA: sialidase family protein, partial [bacterium]|nr:sialidase family protein [bacterium]
MRIRLLTPRLTQILPSLGIAAVLLAGGTARAADAVTEQVPDPRWSLIYHLDGTASQDAPAAPVRRHSSVIQSGTLTPQDSPDVAVLPSSVVTQSEVSTTVDPNNPDLVVVSVNATDWPVTTVFGTGMYWSTDGGTTWTGDDTGPGGVGNSGDPAVAVSGQDGRWVVGYISSGFGQGVSYTTDQGSNWSHVNLFPSGTLDKNHLMIDNVPTSPHYGNVYSAWTAFSGTNNNDIEFVRSTDGGATWDATATNISDAVAAGNHSQGVNIQVGPNGEVYAVFAVYDCWPCEEVA